MEWFKRLFARPPEQYKILDVSPPPKIILAESCFAGLLQCLVPAKINRHEGVALLLGRTDGITSVCVQAVRPRAKTTRGSFEISAAEMAMVVGHATALDLQIVAQVHTHPEQAFHSDGDEEGANIRFDGFVSIVIPNYGAALPSLSDSAIYIFSRAKGWELLPLSSLRILPGATP
jgi:proteasome lid subunit RPN8/RPN11